MKFILVVLLLISLSIVFADEAKVFGKRDSDLVQANVKRDNITLPEGCQCYHTDSAGKETSNACSKDEATNQYFCSSPILQKRGDDDEDEGNQRRPGPSHHDNDDEDEWRHNRPGYGGRPERPERPRLPNLIKNGGFENGFNDWDRLSAIGDWRIQERSHYFYSEIDVPYPPEGIQAAMVASPSSLSAASISQVVDLSQFSSCTAIKFELSFKYFYRNYADDFVVAPLPLQFFSATINRLNVILPIHIAYITAPGLPKSTGNEYIRHKSEFLVSTGINSTPLSSFRVVFGQGSLIRLRVGIDDVQLTGRCHNF
eukprot:TRINITY_DN180_c0_g1_i7.p1 TRINITY_DN180_c0_g1~~TRINITY_DN180_c0_g1_i7.p1  ORF type:complete len:325 (+),score=54.62 TRINITY_DN180_c0_g1_i7:39-977(+)